MPTRRVPLWLKIGYTAWVVVWITLYAQIEKPQHFLWLCHIGNVIIAVGLWRDSPLLLSWQALSLLFADLIWSFDFLAGLLLGQPPLGSNAYMFNPSVSLLQKGLSLFHLGLPVLLIWCLLRFGYDRRAIWLQAVTCWIFFPISYLVSTPAEDINWVYGPFNQPQNVLSPPVFLLVAMVAYIAVLYVPSHLILLALLSRPRGVNMGREDILKKE